MGILLAGYLPGEEHQAVTGYEGRLLAEPDLQLVVVGVITQHSLTTPRDNSDRDPTLTLKWASLEVADAPGDAEKVRALLAQLRSDRLGQEELPGVAEAAADTRPTRPARGRGSRRGHLATVDE